MIDKTGSCETCKFNVGCKWVDEQKTVETELTTIMDKHKNLTDLRIGLACDMFTNIPKEEVKEETTNV